ncbi:hypothetical protein [Neisseria chenwenguii]|uniref:Uncharacterized protein n=1 Tax=Neisseria chenwenguii TaxID=1853278 RepID=A0A220S1W7_9NEIS|nr:hypothetical protein [Neisseria chenwenguii]ASK27500.1 hypothetical protein BG910_06850 [Neisseria chenwenguii]ROV55580.1 hypothetical protein EGS38_08695 [Neisseria chenwenguii]
MKPLYRYEYILVSGGASGCKDCDDIIALEKECRDDINNGFTMGATAGALFTKSPYFTGIGAIAGGALAASNSPECKALAKLKK